MVSLSLSAYHRQESESGFLRHLRLSSRVAKHSATRPKMLLVFLNILKHVLKVFLGVCYMCEVNSILDENTPKFSQKPDPSKLVCLSSTR